MTARAAALPVLVLAAVCIVVWRIMQTSIFWGIFTACAIAAALFLRACTVFIGGSRGAHAAPRRYVLDDDMATAVIDRVATEHDPPWEPAPLAAPVPVLEPAEPDEAPVIEPDAIHGPPQVVITATASGERVTSVQVAVHPPLHWPAALPQWVIDILGHDSVDGAMAEISGIARSFESNFTKGDSRQVRAALTDGAS
jgi:hypothetical protein